VSSAKVASPWFADYAHIIVGKVMPPYFNYQQRKNFFMILDIIFGMIIFFIRRELMVLLDVVYLSLNSKVL
jgi:hypothetical protein